MAERRMFAKSITESDHFLSMPAEAQALYFHLNMAADDDGFCDNPRTIMRQCCASDDSMKLLIAKKFVLRFEKNDGFIVVVKHWKLNNYIRKDTYRETRYKEFMRELYFDENQSYSTNPNDGHIPCIPEAVPELSQDCDEPVTEPSWTRDEPLTQDRIGYSKDKDSIVESIDKDIDSTVEGGLRGEEQSSLPTDRPERTEEEIQERAEWYKKRIAFAQKQGWPVKMLVEQALREGIVI